MKGICAETARGAGWFAMRRSLLAAVVLTVGGFSAFDARAQEENARESTVEAPSIRGIKIDGDLKDWPAAMPRHAIRKFIHFPPDYGKVGLRDADLSTNADLSAAFSVGYDQKEQVIYLAVIVRDDKLVVGHKSYLDSDALEVYIDGLNLKEDIPFPTKAKPVWWELWDLSTLPVHQFVAIPGPPPVWGTKYTTNPVVLAGEITKTKTRMAFSRVGDVTTYEWAIQAFDTYPDKPTKLEPGKRIGFDLAIIDRDVPRKDLAEGEAEPEADRPGWIYWGPQWQGMKVCKGSTLGTLILGKAVTFPAEAPDTPKNIEAGAGTSSAKAAELTPRSGVADPRFMKLMSELEDLQKGEKALREKLNSVMERWRNLSDEFDKEIATSHENKKE